jgi:hypothetical protein
MQKFEILYNLAYSANSNVEIFSTLESPEPTLYDTQQKGNFNQEYFSYNTQIGVAIVNDLNVKGFLDKPENEKIAIDFVNYLKNLLTIDEFRDLFYDNKKLAEFFNDYYNKFINYANQGLNDTIQNNDIDLTDTKDSLFNADEKYLKTNGLTNYYTNTVQLNGISSANNYTDVTKDTDYKNFSGENESYYVNVTINRKNSLLFPDDFSSYFVDKCDGNRNYRKIIYKNEYNLIPTYGNLDELLQIQQTNGNNLGPSDDSIEDLVQLLPVNFLRESNDQNNVVLQQPTSNIITVDEINYNNSLGNNDVIAIPQTLDPALIEVIRATRGRGEGIPDYTRFLRKFNFRTFSEWTKFFGFQYKPFKPSFTTSDQAREKYIYQQTIDIIKQTDDLIAALNLTANTVSGSLSPSLAAQSAIIPGLGLLKGEFEFVKDPNWDSLSFIGQLYNQNITNQLEIKVKHNQLNKEDKVIIQYEYFSLSFIGPENGTNSFNLGIPNTNNTTDPTYELTFNVGDTVKSIFINIYKNWPVRTPIILSLRPYYNPNQVLQYLVIYLDEFYLFRNFSFSEKIEISSFDKCNLMYNGFVYQNFDDNFLTKYRPDNIPVTYIGAAGFTINTPFDPESEDNINKKLYDIFLNNSITLTSIARGLNIPQASIYNIYINGAHYYEKNEADSDADITVVADVTEDVKYFTIGETDFSLYNPITFQYQMNEFAVPAFNDSEVLSDRNFFQYFTEDDKYKIVERISFTTNITKPEFKRKAIEISDSHFNDSEKFFRERNLDKFKKRIWNSIRILVFSIQYLKFGKIVDRKAANNYLYDVENPFENYEEVKEYFYPILKNLKDEIISI